MITNFIVSYNISYLFPEILLWIILIFAKASGTGQGGPSLYC